MLDRYDALAQKILTLTGGRENINEITHCMTRLRLRLVNEAEAETEKLEALEGILAVIKAGGQYQIVIGREVASVYKSLCRKEDLTFLNTTEKKEVMQEPDWIVMPAKGRIIALEEVEDMAFAKGLLGKGIALVPSEGKIYAPCNGEIAAIFPTGHAVEFHSDKGAEVLLHVGLDTVRLKGKGFYPRKKTGDRVKQGELILEFDLKDIQETGYSLVTPMVITNTDGFADIVVTKSGEAERGDRAILLL